MYTFVTRKSLVIIMGEGEKRALARSARRGHVNSAARAAAARHADDADSELQPTTMEFFSNVGGADPLRPSLFELIAQEQLRDLLQPALKYVLSVSAGFG